MVACVFSYILLNCNVLHHVLRLQKRNTSLHSPLMQVDATLPHLRSVALRFFAISGCSLVRC